MGWSGGGWTVQPLACVELGQQMQGWRPESAVHPLEGDPRLAVITELLIAASCNGTNWDRLRRHFLTVAQEEPATIRPDRLTSLTRDAFSQRFGPAYSSDPSGRYEMVMAAARAILDERLPIDAWLGAGLWLNGAGGLLETLSAIAPFSEDPHGKKSRILAQQLVRFGLVEVVDAQDVPPAIEYHLIRLYLRTGRVVPTTPAALRAVQDDSVHRVDSLNALRAAVETAMRITADLAGIPLHELNDAEWQVARSFCTRQVPRCTGPAAPGKPCDQVLLRQGEACPLSSACPAATGPSAGWSEPRLSPRYAYY